MQVQHQTGSLLLTAKISRVVNQIEQLRIERSEGRAEAYALPVWQLMREQVNRSAEWRRANRRSRSGATIEIHTADPRRREENPRVMSRIVGIVERNPIVGDVILSIFEAAEESLAVAQSHAV